jgi:predicted DNA-binding transcriptional regulator AlpA
MSEQQKIVVLTESELEAVIERAILKALSGAYHDGNGNGHAEDHLLTPEEAAEKLNVKLCWLYRHAKKLPFTRRLSRKALRFSEAGLLRWQAAKKNFQGPLM